MPTYLNNLYRALFNIKITTEEQKRIDTEDMNSLAFSVDKNGRILIDLKIIHTASVDAFNFSTMLYRIRGSDYIETIIHNLIAIRKDGSPYEDFVDSTMALWQMAINKEKEYQTNDPIVSPRQFTRNIKNP